MATKIDKHALLYPLKDNKTNMGNTCNAFWSAQEERKPLVSMICAMMYLISFSRWTEK